MPYIYKITNKINGKMYIGQTVNTVKFRFQRHINDAYNGKEMAISRAIRKYGHDNFTVEIIEECEKENLDEREIYWIKYYNSVKIGYNMTDGATNANTYQYKTEEEMEVIKDKIRATKIGSQNPNAIKVKCKNVKTGEELIFDSVIDCQYYFNEDNHNFATRRCLHKTKFLYNGEWAIAYYDDEYFENSTEYKNNRKSRRIRVEDLNTNEVKEFPSFAIAERYFRLPLKKLSSKAYRHKDGKFIVAKRYKVTVIE